MAQKNLIAINYFLVSSQVCINHEPEANKLEIISAILETIGGQVNVKR